MIIRVGLENNPYDILIEKGVINRASEVLNLNRKVMIVTDSGVPYEYSETIKKQCKEGFISVIEAGEASKSLETFAKLSKELLDHNFSRKDCVVAVGGGVVGDLSGFVAACFMRGIDFYNIPTTVLSQVDSSIGGKTAVNFAGVKNIIGAFYQPKKVLIDVEVLKSLSDRLIANGLSEAVKMACTFDAELFEEFEKGYDKENLENLIARSIDIKRRVVEEDEKEQGLRKVLNFGHTIGHGIEVTNEEGLLHGESVGIGMLMMCSEPVKKRLLAVMNAIGLPVSTKIMLDSAIAAISHDKKTNGGVISTVYVDKVGTYELKDLTIDEIKERMISF